MRKVFVALSGLLLLAVVLQFYFAAYGAFTLPPPATMEGEQEAFQLHAMNSNIILLLSLLAAIGALLAKAGWRTALLAFTPFILVWVQIVIFILAGAAGGDPEAVPPVSTPAAHVIVAFHAINALAILGVSIAVLRRAIAHDRVGTAPVPAVP
ncbi:MAG TPA: hypothetical protein DGT23_19135 [Micromonosporaceae bacterium]|nr:hypothetical protein [Micromonosporaceae bacterium]